MSGIVEAKTDKYLNALLPRRDAVLRDMERYAAKHGVPIVGPACGRLLLPAGAARLGRGGCSRWASAIGYSTLWLARAVGAGGTVFYTDGDLANAMRARPILRRAGRG